MPGLTTLAVQMLLSERSDETDAVVAVDPTGRLHPLAAVWSPRVLPGLVVSPEGRARSLTDILKTIRVTRVPLAPEVLLNVNRPEDLGKTPPL